MTIARMRKRASTPGDAIAARRILAKFGAIAVAAVSGLPAPEASTTMAAMLRHRFRARRLRSHAPEMVMSAHTGRMRAWMPGLGLTILLAMSFGLASPPALGADDACLAKGRAEQGRILRAFTRQRPAKGDRAAEIDWARRLEAALSAAAGRADECERMERRAKASTIGVREDTCLARAHREIEALDRRYGGRTLSRQEQAALRAEQERALQARVDCDLATRR